MIRTYSELMRLPTFEERFEYLKLNGEVGRETFGVERYLNQIFYRLPEWKVVRSRVIARDLGCDLAVSGWDIFDYITIHHMNPISKDDILDRSEFLLNPEYLICASDSTHKAIHYGKDNLEILYHTERAKDDTCPWKR